MSIEIWNYTSRVASYLTTLLLYVGNKSMSFMLKHAHNFYVCLRMCVYIDNDWAHARIIVLKAVVIEKPRSSCESSE